MRAKRLKFGLAIAAVLATAWIVPTMAVTLSEGDPAPSLAVDNWVQGEAVPKIEPGKAYIVEFWATWCGPCLESIPHLNQLHNKFKDKGLVVIGVDSGEPSAKVVPFLKKMGDKMTYRVATDMINDSTPEGKTVRQWTEAAGKDTIPTAFVVNKKGTIVFIGHPMDLDETIVQGVLDGSFDAPQAAAMRKKMLDDREELAKLSSQLDASLQDKQWDKAQGVIDQLEKLVREDSKQSLGMMRLKIDLNRGDSKAASKQAEQLGEKYGSDPLFLTAVGWVLITTPGISEADRDLPLSEKLAAKGNELSGGKDLRILDAYARVLFVAGKKDKAIECETQAVSLASGDAKSVLAERLAGYKSGKLPELKP